MTNDETPLAGGEVNVASEPQTIEHQLGSYDFDDRPQAPPAGDAAENKEPGDESDLVELVEAGPADGAPKADDDPEVILRDNTKVKLSDLKKAYRPTWENEVKEFESRQKDIEQKTQFFTQQEQLVMQAANAAAAIAQRYVPQPPDPELRKTDPFAFIEAEGEYKDRMSELQGLQQAMAQANQQAAEKQKQAQQQYFAKQQQQLLTLRPELKDPVKMTKWWEDAKQAGANVGFTEQDLLQVPDYRVILLAEKAKKYDDLLAQKVKLAEKAKNAKPMEAPVQAPGPRTTSAGAEAMARREQLSRLRKTGSVKDAESALSMFD